MPILSLTEPSMWLIAIATATIAGFIRGFTGFGGPAIMILVLVQFYAPVSVLTKVAIIDTVSSIKLLPSTAREVDRKLIVCLVLSSLIGAPVGVYALLEIDPVLMKRAIAIVAAVCTIVMLSGWRMTRVPPLWVQFLVGFISGVILGATFIALLMIVFLFASPVSAAQSRANTIYWVFSVGVAIIVGYAWMGVLEWGDVWRSILIGAVYLLAATIGAAFFRSTTERSFRRIALFLLLALSTFALIGN